MRQLTDIPTSVKAYFSDQIRIQMLLAKSNQFKVSIPQRIVKMTILKNGKNSLKDVIVPAIGINFSQDQETGLVPSNSIKYFVHSTRQAFPLAHIFRSSGSVCYGSIFIPKNVPVHQVILPLDSLFIYNDRYIAHGHPLLTMSKKQHEEINTILFESNLTPFTPTDDNLIAKDDLWVLSNTVLEESETISQAYNIMGKIFDILFPTSK